MNWKSEAVERLRDYELKKNAVAALPEQIAALEAAAVSIRGAVTDGTPVKGGGSRREDALLSNIVKRQELSENLGRAVQWVALTDRALAALSNEERTLLDRFYICPQRGAAGRLAEELCYDTRTVYQKKDQALRRFTLALYGCCEN